MKPAQHILGTLFIVIWLGNIATAAPNKNGFDLSTTLIPAAEILHGGPPRDGIPAIDQPQFISAAAAHFLAPSDRVMGVKHQGITRAYPIAIMNWHEIVNDRFDKESVVITYCPLCGSGMAFLATIDDNPLNFGVSGLLYNNDMLLYDRQTQSLWSQLMAQAISGKHRGRRLIALPVNLTSWSDWHQRHPDTLVLSTATGYARDYQRSPYADYASNQQVFFPMKFRSQGYHPKETVLGIEVNEQYKAYPYTELARTNGTIHDRFAGQDIEIHFDASHQTARIIDVIDSEITSVTAYWFAWYGFHPDTAVYQEND